jgi:histidine ammonia-lyase
MTDTPSERCIPWQDFEQVLKIYGAAEQEMAWARQLVQVESTALEDPPTLQGMQLDDRRTTSNASVPIANIRAVVQLFGQSVWHR